AVDAPPAAQAPAGGPPRLPEGPADPSAAAAVVAAAAPLGPAQPSGGLVVGPGRGTAPGPGAPARLASGDPRPRTRAARRGAGTGADRGVLPAALHHQGAACPQGARLDLGQPTGPRPCRRPPGRGGEPGRPALRRACLPGPQL